MHNLVSDLIILGTRSWNVALIKKIFDLVIINLITNIHLSQDPNQEDKFKWTQTRNGSFSYKSAYHTLMIERQNDSASTSHNYKNHLHNKGKLPPRIHNFLWRIYNNAIPNRKNLFKIKILENSICSICNKHEEDGYHFFSCAFAIEI